MSYSVTIDCEPDGNAAYSYTSVLIEGAIAGALAKINIKFGLYEDGTFVEASTVHDLMEICDSKCWKLTVTKD